MRAASFKRRSVERALQLQDSKRALFVIIGSHEWLACLRFAVLVMISPRLEAADDAFDDREDGLNVDDRRFGLS